MSNQVQKVANPFAGSSPGKELSEVGAAASSDSDRSIQEVQAAMVIAKRFPRDLVEVGDRIMNACTRPALAEGALYSYPRGGQEVTGPSIRLAEAMAQIWGNMQFGIRELSKGDGFSTVEAFAWDIETNTRQVKVFQVDHWRDTKKGGYKLTDQRDIYELIANNGARRLRACILGVIPGDITEAAVAQCEQTQTASVNVTPDTIKAMAKSFSDTYGVTTEMIEGRLGKRLEAINAGQMLSLRKIFQSLKEGISKPGDWFDIGVIEHTPETKTSDLNIKPAKEKTDASSSD